MLLRALLGCFLLLLLAASVASKPEYPYPFFPCEIPSYETQELIDQRHALTPDVDPFIGTGGDGYGCAGLPPGAQLPFGLCRVSPDSIYKEVRFGWRLTGGYSYCDDEIRAFSHTHLVGAGALDGGTIGVIPVLNFTSARSHCYNPTVDGNDLRFCLFKQPFLHESELAEPGGYNVVLNDPAGPNASIVVNLTATQHAAFHRYTYAPNNGLPFVLFDLCHSNSVGVGNCPNASISLDFQANGSVVAQGYVYNYGDFSKRYGGNRIWFYAVLSGGGGALPSQSGIWLADGTLLSQQTSALYVDGRGPNSGAYIAFADARSPVEMRIGISYIDQAGAVSNLGLEIQPADTFESVLGRARSSWAQALSVVQIDSTGQTQQERTKFFTALYHTMLAPTNWTEADGRYLGFDMQVHEYPGFDLMTDLSIWDIFRTEFPLLVFLRPDIAHNVVRSLMLMNDQLPQGLPKWALCNGDTGSMEGLFAVTMIADALLSATVSQDGINATEALVMAVNSLRSREGALWTSPGYVESASDTLCYAVNDFCVSQLATTGAVPTSPYSQAVAEQFLNTSRNWENLWDKRTRFICARDPQTGNYTQCDDPLFVPLISKRPMDTGYTEGDAWQYRWFVPQDMPQLVSQFGGSKPFVKELEHFFQASTYTLSNFMPNAFFWAGNEPDIQTPYLFNYASPPRLDLMSQWVRWTSQYHYTQYANGISGNDDYGTMSAWLVWSSLGLFPDNCRQRYFLGIPLFDSAVVQLANENVLKIVAHNNQLGFANITVSQVLFNSEPLTEPFIDSTAVQKGGLLEFFISFIN